MSDSVRLHGRQPTRLGFSRQEHWSGLPFPPPMRESEVAQLPLTLSSPMDYSPPGSSVHGIFQARVLEWGAIAFSNIYIYIHLSLSSFSTHLFKGSGPGALKPPVDYAKAFDCVDHNKLWKILKEMGIPDHFPFPVLTVAS